MDGGRRWGLDIICLVSDIRRWFGVLELLIHWHVGACMLAGDPSVGELTAATWNACLWFKVKQDVSFGDCLNGYTFSLNCL